MGNRTVFVLGSLSFLAAAGIYECHADQNAGGWHEIKRIQMEGPLNAVAFSPDGNSLVSLADFGRTVTIVGVGQRAISYEFHRFAGGYSGNSVAFLNDGSIITSTPVNAPSDGSGCGTTSQIGGACAHLDNFALLKWNARAGKAVRVFPDSKVTSIQDLHSADKFSASADSSMLAGINVIGVLLFDAKTGALNNIIKDESQAEAVALSPDGSKVAVSYFGGQVTLFDTRSGAVVRTISAYSDGFYNVGTLAYSPDGRFVACGVYTASDGHRVNGQWTVRQHNAIAVNIWDITTGKFVAALQGDPVRGTTDDANSVWGLSWNRAGDMLAVGSLKAVRIWKRGQDRSSYILSGEIQTRAYSLSFAPDGELATASGNDVVFYSAKPER